MTKEQPESLEQLIRACGEDWIIDSFSPREQALQYLEGAIREAAAVADRRRLGVDLTVKSLLNAFRKHPSQVNAFIQALGAVRTPQMLVMVWRIIQGMTISRVEMSYEEQAAFHLRVVLASPYGESDEVFESSNIDDASLLRHFGAMKMDDKPLFDGFYALKSRRPA
jgi:hypothetical protein